MNIHQTRPLARWFGWGRYEWRLEFKLPDLWLGLFFVEDEAWLCLLPCLPLHIKRLPVYGSCADCGNLCGATDELCPLCEEAAEMGEPP